MVCLQEPLACRSVGSRRAQLSIRRVGRASYTHFAKMGGGESLCCHAVHAVYSPLPAFGAALAWSVAGKVESDMHRLASAPLSAIAARVHWSLTVPCGCSSFPHAGEAVHVPPSGGDSLSEEGQSAQRTCASPCGLFLCCSHRRNCAHGCRPFCACRCCCHMTQTALPSCFLNLSCSIWPQNHRGPRTKPSKW